MKKTFHIKGINNFGVEISFKKGLSRTKLSEDEIKFLIKIIKELDSTKFGCESSANNGDDNEL